MRGFVTVDLQLFDRLGLEFSEYVFLNFVKDTQAKPENGGKFYIKQRLVSSRQKPEQRLYEVVLNSTVRVKTYQGAAKMLDRLQNKGLIEIDVNSEWLQVTSLFIDAIMLQNDGDFPTKRRSQTQPAKPKNDKITHFEESIYFNNESKFIDDIKAHKDFKRSDIDFSHYYRRCLDWSMNNGTKKNWVTWAVMIITDDMQKGQLKTISNSFQSTPSVNANILPTLIKKYGSIANNLTSEQLERLKQAKDENTLFYWADSMIQKAQR